MEELSNTVAPRSETTFSRLAKDVDSAYTGETTIRTRIVADSKRLAHFLFTGPELVVTIVIFSLLVSVYHFDLGVGAAFGIFGGVIGLYSLYQNRE